MFEKERMRNSFEDTGNSAEALKARPKPLHVSPRTKARMEHFQRELAQKLLKKHVSQVVAYGSRSKGIYIKMTHFDFVSIIIIVATFVSRIQTRSCHVSHTCP
jgi:hypothetical protein